MPSLIPRGYTHLDQIWHDSIGPSLGRLLSCYLTRYSIPCNDIGLYSVDNLVQISTGAPTNLIKVFRDSLQSLHTNDVTAS
jgi:hypothetical protein